jgi:predicted CXXCH cytochrome family protein
MTLLAAPARLHSMDFVRSAHGDRSMLPKGCASCHKGHGMMNTPMLSNSGEDFCFQCHGDAADSQQARRAGILSGIARPGNLKRVFQKIYHHPVEKTGIHRYNEILPEKDSSTPRHAECVDCHQPHYVTKRNKTQGISGVNQEGAIVESIQSEYELCFKCHSYSANLPGDQTNKAELFNPANMSYHPVVARGKNSSVPSLIRPMSPLSLIKCSDCHNNDDPLGPQGPHASNFAHILKRNFEDTDGIESPNRYDLCYGCHRRSSILSNTGFKYHYEHIVNVGASCRTCHNPHGSKLYPHLIDFDNLSIMPSSGGRLGYTSLGPMAGQCYLTCHGKDHNPASYPVNLPVDSFQRLLK